MRKRLASADSDQEIHGRAAVARIQYLSVMAGFIWREITGRDIGIDAVLEHPGSDKQNEPSCGLLLLQIKASQRNPTKKPMRSRNVLTVKISERNHDYWLAQRLPVILCIVDIIKGPKNKSAYAYWIDV